MTRYISHLQKYIQVMSYFVPYEKINLWTLMTQYPMNREIVTPSMIELSRYYDGSIEKSW